MFVLSARRTNDGVLDSFYFLIPLQPWPRDKTAFLPPATAFSDLSVAPALPLLDQNTSKMPLAQFVSLSLLMPGGARRRLLWSQTLLLRMCVCCMHFPRGRGMAKREKGGGEKSRPLGDRKGIRTVGRSAASASDIKERERKERSHGRKRGWWLLACTLQHFGSICQKHCSLHEEIFTNLKRCDWLAVEQFSFLCLYSIDIFILCREVYFHTENGTRVHFSNSPLPLQQ